MIDQALRKLKLDRRLLDRRGWIAPDELERELAALADVSGKAAPPEEAPGVPEAAPPGGPR